ncbi:type II toxin-antitoxin system VapC family toxin [Myxococcota bacterium]|nr:type II toxin-antitoxin system VapC family toxin [Myxococcota bacterium]
MYLLDTNIISELRKAKSGRANPGVIQWATQTAPQSLFISTITVLEIEMGILSIERRDLLQGRALRGWFNDQVIPSFANRILSIDVAVALRCAALHVPDPRPERDALIAATALVHQMVIVTRNTADFERTAVGIINPWRA